MIAARVHHAARRRRRRGRLRRARSSRANAAHRRADAPALRTIRNHRPASRRSCRGCRNWAGPIGRNVRIDYRWAAGDADASQIRGGIGRARSGRHPGLSAPRQRRLATGDPHRADRVRACASTRSAPAWSTSLARPGGNVTGFIQFEYGMAGNGWSCSKRSRRA